MPPRLLHVTSGESAGNTLRQTTLGGGGAAVAGRPPRGAGPGSASSRTAPSTGRLSGRRGLGTPARDPRLARAPGRPAPPCPRRRRRGRPLVRARPLRPAPAPRRALSRSERRRRAGSHHGGLVPRQAVLPRAGRADGDELETLWPERRRASAGTVAAAVKAWEALRAPEPSTLAELAQREEPELPFLASALRRLLEELPAPGDGLSGTERRALTAIAAGHTTPREASARHRTPKRRRSSATHSVSSRSPAPDRERGEGARRRGEPSRAPRDRPLGWRDARNGVAHEHMFA